MSKRNNFFGSFASVTYTARTIAFLNFIGIPNDGTVYYNGTPQEITGAGIWTAVNNFDLGLISNGLDTAMKAIYLMIGGTATTHKINFMNPADTDAAFRLTYSGGWTHSGTGAKPNGINGAADPHYTLSTEATVSNFSFGIYSRTNDTTGSQLYGCNSGVSIFAQHNLTSANMFSGTIGNLISYSANPSTRFFFHRRTASNFSQSYRDGASIGSETVAGAGLGPIKFYFGARNGSEAPSGHELAFGCLGGGAAVSNTGAGNLRTLVDTLQTSLFRNV